MDKLITKILLPLLLLALVVAVYYESGSVKSFDLDTGYSAPKGVEPRPLASPQQTRSTAPQGAVVKSRLAVGERYASLDELVNDQQAGGYLKTGYFGKYWPATVTQITHDNDGIVFVRGDGTKHTYSGFEGYRMRMVRLSGGAQRETIVVFRSVAKR